MTTDLDEALRRVSRTPVLLVACDFDGTLSPIVADPTAAAPDPEAIHPLYGLAVLPRTPVLVISGRALQDLGARLGPSPEGVALIGSHGAETDTGARPHPDVESFGGRLRPVVEGHPGSEVEIKPFSVAFHFRNVVPQDQSDALERAVAEVGPLAAHVKHGKKVVEFMAVRADKGTALQRYRSACGATATLFVGDDVTDEAAFEQLTLQDVGVKVGPGSTAARYRVHDQRDVARLLAAVQRHRAEHLGG